MSESLLQILTTDPDVTVTNQIKALAPTRTITLLSMHAHPVLRRMGLENKESTIWNSPNLLVIAQEDPDFLARFLSASRPNPDPVREVEDKTERPVIRTRAQLRERLAQIQAAQALKKHKGMP